jgi:hypothetical protein
MILIRIDLVIETGFFGGLLPTLFALDEDDFDRVEVGGQGY